MLAKPFTQRQLADWCGTRPVTEPHRALVFVVDDPEVVRLVTRTLGEFDFATQAFRDGPRCCGA
jgi:hypothetical protein